LAGAAAGAAIGSVFPIVGTAIGAAVGAVSGVVVGIAIDMAALAIDEGLTREAMRKDLVDSVAETLRPMRETFGCK
jgi:phage tail tape-measure protein